MTSSDEIYTEAIKALVPEPEAGWPKVADMTADEKALLRPMAETFAMLDGNAFFGAFTDGDGDDVHYEEYLPEAKALFEANGGMNGAAGNASFALAAKEAEAFAAVLDDPLPGIEKVERRKRSVGQDIVGSLEDALEDAVTEAAMSTTDDHSDTGTVVQPDEAALIVQADGEIKLAFPHYEDDEQVPPMVTLLAAVLVQARDEEWVAEQLQILEDGC